MWKPKVGDKVVCMKPVEGLIPGNIATITKVKGMFGRPGEGGKKHPTYQCYFDKTSINWAVYHHEDECHLFLKWVGRPLRKRRNNAKS